MFLRKQNLDTPRMKWEGGGREGREQCLDSLFGRGLTIKSHQNLEIKSSMIIFMFIYWGSLQTLRLVSDKHTKVRKSEMGSSLGRLVKAGVWA